MDQAPTNHPQWIGNGLPILSGLFASACIFLWATDRTSWIGPALTGCFLSLALAASTGQGLLRQLAFTIWIATGVVVGMSFHESFITFPPWFFGLGDRELTVLFIPVLQIIMFAMGTTLMRRTLPASSKCPLVSSSGLFVSSRSCH